MRPRTRAPCLVLINTWKADTKTVYVRASSFLGGTYCVGDLAHVWPQNFLQCVVLKMIVLQVKYHLVLRALWQLCHKEVPSGIQMIEEDYNSLGSVHENTRKSLG